MTTAVTIKFANMPVYVYEANLDENNDGDFLLVSKLTEGEQTFHVHSSRDLLITENPLTGDE